MTRERVMWLYWRNLRQRFPHRNASECYRVARIMVDEGSVVGVEAH